MLKIFITVCFLTNVEKVKVHSQVEIVDSRDQYFGTFSSIECRYWRQAFQWVFEYRV